MMGSGPYYGVTRKGLERYEDLSGLLEKDALVSPRLQHQYFILDMFMEQGPRRSIALVNPEFLMEGERIDPQSKQWLREFRRLINEGYITEDSPYTKDTLISAEDLEFHYWYFEDLKDHDYPRFSPPEKWNKEFWN